MFNRALFENSGPDGFPVMEVAGEDPAAPLRFVPLRRTEVRGEVTGPLADLRLVQTFGYSADQCDKTIQALYRFPLPGDAAVTGVTVRFGDVEIRAELKERADAEKDYNDAMQAGRQAALATRESPDVFTLRIAGLNPDEEIRVETACVQMARMEAGEWTLRIPLTTAPRYVRADEANSRHAQGQPLAILRDPGHRFAMDLRFPGAGAVSSSTHALTAEPDRDALRVRMQQGEVVPDRDCVLSWSATAEDQHPALHLHVHDDPADDSVYFLALIAPPAAPGSARAPRESILLVDHSGSMSGAKWEAADWAVKQFLNGLRPEDTVALGLFHNSVNWFADRPRKADSGTVAAATEFLLRNRDSGGTELGVALEQALGQKRAGGEIARHVLILTDAEVSDEGRILRLAETESARADRRRISVLCIDAAPNSFLARELAERGGGTATFLTSQPDQEDISTALDRILEDWSAPVMTGLRLEVSRAGAQAVGRTVSSADHGHASAIDIGDLPAGRAVWVAGRVPRGASRDLAFRLVTLAGKQVAARRVDLEAGLARPALKALFGASRVLALEFLATSYYDDAQIRSQLKRLGYDPAEMARKADGERVYAENLQLDTQDALSGLLAREALRYGLACSETAFVAVRKEAGKLVEGTAVVANALPAGWSDDFEMCAAALPVSAMQRHSTLTAYGAAGPGTGFDFSTPGACGGMAPPTPMPQARSQGGPGQSGPGRAGGIVGAVTGLFKKSAARPAGASSPGGLSVPPFLQQADAQADRSAALFTGTPRFTGTESVLFDTSRTEDALKLADDATVTRLTIRFTGSAPDPNAIDSGLAILIFIDDLAAPRARVRLADLLKQGNVRPLNLRRAPGQVVRIVLVDPNVAWSQGAPPLEVSLA